MQTRALYVPDSVRRSRPEPLEIVRIAALLPLRAAALAAFAYAFGGWMLLPPAAIWGLF